MKICTTSRGGSAAPAAGLAETIGSRVLVCLFVLYAALVGSPARAQDSESWPLVGQRVRVSTASREKQSVGTLTGMDRIRLVVSDENGVPTSIPRTDVTRLEVSDGKRSNAGKGALVGALIGIGLGLTYVADNCSEGCGNVAGGLLTLGAMGGAIGAAIGAPIRTERWRSVPVSRTASLQLDLTRSRGVQVALAVTF